MAQYSINHLEKLTGIKAHTLRIWEKRYGLLKPDRTDTNIRFYSDQEAKKILKVSALYKQGYKISKLAAMSETEVNKIIVEQEHKPTDHSGAFIELLTIAMIDLNQEQFEKLFKESVEKTSFTETMLYVIYPFLEKIGVLWQVGDIHPAQEHFASNLIRQKIIARIDGIDKHYESLKEPIIMYLPEGELHEIGLLFYSYLLQELKYQVIYLGQTLPVDDLLKIAEHYTCKYYFTSMVASTSENNFLLSINSILKKIPTAKIFVFGGQATELTLSIKVLKIYTVKDIYKYL